MMFPSNILKAMQEAGVSTESVEYKTFANMPSFNVVDAVGLQMVTAVKPLIMGAPKDDSDSTESEKTPPNFFNDYSEMSDNKENED